MIPVDKDSPFYAKDDRPQSLPTNSPVDTVDSATSHLNNNASKSLESATVLSPEEENRKDIDDFLGKIDSTLAETKKYVAKSQHSFEWVVILLFYHFTKCNNFTLAKFVLVICPVQATICSQIDEYTCPHRHLHLRRITYATVRRAAALMTPHNYWQWHKVDAFKTPCNGSKNNKMNSLNCSIWSTTNNYQSFIIIFIVSVWSVYEIHFIDLYKVLYSEFGQICTNRP